MSQAVGDLVFSQTGSERKSISDGLPSTATPPPFKDILGNYLFTFTLFPIVLVYTLNLIKSK